MTNAQRQALYRERRRDDADRVSAYLGPDAKRQLQRLAAHWGLTQRAALERALAEAERVAVDGLPGAEPRACYDGPGVTQ